MNTLTIVPDIESELTRQQHTTSAVRRIQFCAGHRVFKHESKCHRLHGHNYVAFFHAQGSGGLDELGRVIDFGVLKEKLASWIEANWDHGFILWKKDTAAVEAIQRLDGQHVFLLSTNPTAENMAAHLLHVVAPAVLQGTGVVVHKVVLWETENCFVEVTLNAGR